MDELWDESAIGGVWFARSIAVNRSYPDGLRTELVRRVKAHELSRPFCHSIVIELLNCDSPHYVLRHCAGVIPVYLCATKEDQSELVLLLQPDHVFRSDGVRLPQVFIVLLPIPSAIFSGKMVNGIKFASLNDTS